MKKLMTFVFVAALSTASMGCYGPFQLTKKLHKWNGEVGSKWANEAVFLVLNILPVYGIAAFGDAIIFNSIEFWTGKNPMSAKQTRVLQEGDRRLVMTYTPDSRRLRVDSFVNEKPAGTFIVQPGLNDTMVATTADGKTLRSSTDAQGTVTIAREDGSVVAAYPANTFAKPLNN